MNKVYKFLLIITIKCIIKQIFSNFNNVIRFSKNINNFWIDLDKDLSKIEEEYKNGNYESYIDLLEYFNKSKVKNKSIIDITNEDVFGFFFPNSLGEYYSLKKDMYQPSSDRFTNKGYYDLVNYFKSNDKKKYSNVYYFDPIYNYDEIYSKYETMFENIIKRGLKLYKGNPIFKNYYYFKFYMRYFIYNKIDKKFNLLLNKEEIFMYYHTSTTYLFIPEIDNKLKLNYEEFMISTHQFIEKFRKNNNEKNNFYKKNLINKCEKKKVWKLNISFEKMFHLYNHIVKVIKELEIKNNNKSINNYTVENIISNNCNFYEKDFKIQYIKKSFSFTFDNINVNNELKNNIIGFMTAFKQNSYIEFYFVYYIIYLSLNNINTSLSKIIDYEPNDFININDNKINTRLSDFGPKLMKIFNIYDVDYWENIYLNIKIIYLKVLKLIKNIHNNKNKFNLKQIDFIKEIKIYKNGNSQSLSNVFGKNNKSISQKESLNLFLIFSQVLFEYSIEKTKNNPFKSFFLTIKKGFIITKHKIKNYIYDLTFHSSAIEKIMFTMNIMFNILVIVGNIPNTYIFAIQKVLLTISEIYSNGSLDMDSDKFNINYLFSNQTSICKYFDIYLYNYFILGLKNKNSLKKLLKNEPKFIKISSNNLNSKIINTVVDNYVIQENIIYNN